MGSLASATVVEVASSSYVSGMALAGPGLEVIVVCVMQGFFRVSIFSVLWLGTNIPYNIQIGLYISLIYYKWA